MKRHLNCFNPNSIELRIFCGLYFDFVLSTVIKYKALVGVLSSSIGQCLSTLPGSDFPAATEQKHITDLFCFERAHYTTKFFIFFYVFFHGVCKPCNEPGTSGDWTHKYHNTAILFITRFLYWTFLYLLCYILLSLIGIFFRYLFVLTHFDSSRRHDNTGDSYANSPR